eukprot:1361816-Pleurochrysis_carterae.AAC.1
MSTHNLISHIAACDRPTHMPDLRCWGVHWERVVRLSSNAIVQQILDMGDEDVGGIEPHTIRLGRQFIRQLAFSGANRIVFNKQRPPASGGTHKSRKHLLPRHTTTIYAAKFLFPTLGTMRAESRACHTHLNSWRRTVSASCIATKPIRSQRTMGTRCYPECRTNKGANFNALPAGATAQSDELSPLAKENVDL